MAALARRGHLDGEALIRTVLERNPSLDAARRAWQAARERRTQASAHEDPMAWYGIAPRSIGSSDVRFGHELRLSQRLPYPGTLRLRGAAAEAEAEALEQDHAALRLRLATEAALLFADYYLAFRAVEINEQHIGLLEELKQAATAAYAAGSAAQHEPLQAEAELAHRLHDRVVLETTKRTLGARLNALLHRWPEEPLPPPPVELPVPEEAIAGADATALRQDAVSLRPELRASDAEIRSLAAVAELRRLDTRPDFEAMASYNSMWAEAEHQWMIGVGITLPLQRRRIRAAVAEAQASLARAQSERSALEYLVRSEVQQAYDLLLESHHVFDLYRSRLLPAARDQVNAALSGFTAARTSFLAVIEAERNQRTAQLGFEEARADYHRMRARLDRAVGRLPLLDRNAPPAAAQTPARDGQPGGSP